MFAKKQSAPQKQPAKDKASSSHTVSADDFQQQDLTRAALEHPSLDLLQPDVVRQLQAVHGNAFVSRLLQRARAAEQVDPVAVQQRVNKPVVQMKGGSKINARLNEILEEIEQYSPRNRLKDPRGRVSELNERIAPLSRKAAFIQGDADTRERKRRTEAKGEALSDEEFTNVQKTPIPEDLQKKFGKLQKKLIPLRAERDEIEKEMASFDPSKNIRELEPLIEEVHELREDAKKLGQDDLVARAEFILRRAVLVALQGAVDNNAPAPPSVGELAARFGVPIEMPKPLAQPKPLNLPEFTAITAAIENDVPNSKEADEYSKTADNTEAFENVGVQTEIMLGRIREAYLYYLLQKATHGEGLLGVFLGPEWYFGSVRVYNVEQRNYVIDTLVAASLKYPNMLIVPGTILWTPDGTNIVNSAPVIINGTLKRLLAKKNYGGDTPKEDMDKFVGKSHPDRSKHVAKKNESGLFQIGNVSFALDICQDHWEAEAKREYYANQEPGPGVQVHLITAAGRSPGRENLVTVPGGIVFGADADTQEAYVSRGDGRRRRGDNSGKEKEEKEKEEEGEGKEETGWTQFSAEDYTERSKELIDTGTKAVKGTNREQGRFGALPTSFSLPEASRENTIRMDRLRATYGALVSGLSEKEQLQALIAIHEASGGETLRPMKVKALMKIYGKMGELNPREEIEVMLGIERYVKRNQNKKKRAEIVKGMTAALRQVNGANRYLAQGILMNLKR